MDEVEKNNQIQIFNMKMSGFSELDRLVNEAVSAENGLPGVVLIALNRKGL